MVGASAIKNLDDLLVGPTELGAWLGVSGEWVRQLTVEGVLTRRAKGQYPLKASVQAYLAWLKDEQRRSSKSAADSRLKDERARRESLRTAREERQLAPLDEVFAFGDDVCGIVGDEMRAVPARVSRDREARAPIEKEVDAALTRMAARIRERAAALRSGGDAADADPEDDAGGVGSEE